MTTAARTLLIRNARLLATMDDAGTEIAGGGVFARGRAIEQVGDAASLPATADTVIDASGCVVLPGLVNTHHHMFQSLTRAVPAAQDAGLFGWLRALYPLWARLTPEMIETSALVAMAELVLSGCTTSSDHLYLYPNGARLDDTIAAARRIGLRFHPTRGAMSLGESAGGLPPDSLVEREDAVLADMRRVIETFHDPARFSMLRVGLAPCSPFTVTPDLMRESAAMARAYGVRLHTHLAETTDEAALTQERYGKTPAEYAEDLGWVGADVWHAHCVHLTPAAIGVFAATGTGVAHCPCSNMRLGSGQAPVRAMRQAGVRVGLGVDGSASNDSGHMLGEARQALLLARLGGGPAALDARAALRLATRGGAAVLGRDDIGVLAPGMAADVVGFDTDALGFAGALHDPVAALVFCRPVGARFGVIDGRVVVQDGALHGVDLRALVATQNRLARTLADADR